ncbi:kelch repeat and BTB domain-containing protein 13 isoform X2 [Nerophis lumbriciformis]|uniref:kelch repeat and BTB domain-containing protein 13 isoform X2 n=1 Tax=Nerophis lumbriciformis TaxID=546530 RepID=UPI002AE01E48|nr:actin-binding protein IPP-like isoform X2 [Nerophis lumbriciformis]
MNLLSKCLGKLLEWISTWMKCGLMRLCRVFATASALPRRASCQSTPEEWTSSMALRTYDAGGQSMVTVQTSTHTFYVDLGGLSDCSQYFRALSQSGMKETEDGLVCLDHVSSSAFYGLLEFYFRHTFRTPPEEELGLHIQASSYLLAETFLAKCLSVLADVLRPENCLSYLSLAQEICCVELRSTVLAYLSRNLLELPHVIRRLTDQEREELILLRTQGKPHLCSLRKENLTTWRDPATERARHVFALHGGGWRPITEFPFTADKWSFSAVVMYNYLYIIGGYRTLAGRSWHFKMASFRYNPLTQEWAAIAPLIKRRRHFSAVCCQGRIYAVGGWYLDSLLSPDSNTALHTAVECYNPWEDTWRFVSSLPLTDFQFSVSLSHDVPLATSLAHCLLVLGSIQRTGEKVLLQYHTEEDSWSELRPPLTRAHVHLPVLYFLGASADRLLVVGGDNSHNVMTSFCVRSQQWGQVHRLPKAALVGQGTLVGQQVLMASLEHNTVVTMDQQSLSFTTFPPLPTSVCYEAVFYLHIFL